MKISVLTPKTVFTQAQLDKLSSLGDVNFVSDSSAMSVDSLKEFALGSDIIAPDPDAFGGFEKGKPVLTEVMKSLDNLKSVCLTTTSFGWIDVEYCKSKNISISNIPGYSSESVAEHTLALLLCLAKRILITDRRTQNGAYKMEKGFELKGKTLGVIGLGNIGSRVAELGRAVGMNVIAYNRTPKTLDGVTMKSLDDVMSESDAISINVTHEDSNKLLISKELLSKMKESVIMVNTVADEIVDEIALSELLKSGKMYGYALETGDIANSPLAGIENAILLEGFGWYTKEALENLWQILVDNITAAVSGNPQNRIA